MQKGLGIVDKMDGPGTACLGVSAGQGDIIGNVWGQGECSQQSLQIQKSLPEPPEYLGSSRDCNCHHHIHIKDEDGTKRKNSLTRPRPGRVCCFVLENIP